MFGSPVVIKRDCDLKSACESLEEGSLEAWLSIVVGLEHGGWVWGEVAICRIVSFSNRQEIIHMYVKWQGAGEEAPHPAAVPGSLKYAFSGP